MKKPRKNTHGGWRPGAGRKPKGEKAGEVHRTRPEVDERRPVHVTIGVDKAIGSMRRKSIRDAWQIALTAVLGRGDFRIVHVSIQADHIHCLCEADDQYALANGMRALTISAARRMNEVVSRERGEVRRGRVFTDRYHAEKIETPAQCRAELVAVLNNWRRHGEDQGADGRGDIDPYSSASRFEGWAGHEGHYLAGPDGFDDLPVALPTTWLLRIGWKRKGAIGLREVPERAT